MNIRWLFLIFWQLCAMGCVFAQQLTDQYVADQITITDELSVDSAITVLQKLSQHPEFETVSCKLKGDLFFTIGANYYYDEQEEMALRYWRDTALVIYQECLGPGDYLTAKTIFNIGSALKYLERRVEALSYLKRGTKLFEAIPDLAVDDLAYRYLETGKLYCQLEDFDQALPYLLAAQRNYQAADVLNDEVGDLYNYLGICLNGRGEYQNALRYFQRALETSEKIGDKSAIPHIYHNIGIAYLRQADYEKAQQSVEKAMAVHEAEGNKAELVRNLHLLGIVEKRRGAYDLALRHFEKSIELAKQAYPSGFHSEIAAGYENAADVFCLKGMVEKGLQYYQQAISKIVPAFNGRDLLAQPSVADQVVKQKTYLQRLLDLKAQALIQWHTDSAKEGVMEAAYQCYLTIDTLSNQLRQRFQAGGSRFRFQRQLVPVYEQAIELSLQLYEQKKDIKYLHQAYAFASKNKALVLLDGIQNEEAKFLAHLPDSLLQVEQKLKSDLVALENTIYEQTNVGAESQILSLRTQHFELRRRYEKLVDHFEKRYPAYYELKYRFRAPLAVAALQELLPDDGLLLEYFVGDTAIYTFALSRTYLRYYRLEKPGDFEASCIAFRESIQEPGSNWQSVFMEKGFKLYQWLLKAPLETNLAQNPPRRLFIIPDDLLLQISFDALLFEPISIWKGNQNPYLLKRYAVTIAYARQLLFDRQKQGRIAAALDNFLGFGIEYDDYTLQGVGSLEPKDSLYQKRGMGRLPFSDDEVLEVAAIVQGKARVNEQATKAFFMENAANYRILHLAMHGVLDELIPGQSGFIFNRSPEDSSEFILRAAEIYNLQLNAQMGVLSACNTGFGKLERGEGVRSLARAFAYAGCPSLLASLWEAPDNSSKEILVTFYKYLKAGQSKDLALQQAKLDYLEAVPKAYGTPNFWAHLTVVGDPEPLFKNKSHWSLIWSAAVIILALVIGVYWYKRRPRIKN